MHKLIFIIALLFFPISKLSFAVEATHTSLNRCDSELLMESGTTKECVTTPEYYRMHIVEMGVCNNIDAFTKPGSSGYSSSNWDIHSKCFKFFEATNDSVPLLIENGISQSFSTISGGKISKPPNGTYTHGYALITGTIEIKGKVFFTSGTNATGYKPDGVNTVGDGTGNVCWTNGTGSFSWGNAPKTKCGASIDESYSESSVYFSNIHGAGDCITGSGPDFYCNFYSNGPYSDISEGLDPTTAILIDSNFNLASDPTYGSGNGQVKYLLGIATYNSPLVINDSTLAIDTQFKVTRGFHVTYGNNVHGVGLLNQVNLGLLEWKTVTRAQ